VTPLPANAKIASIAGAGIVEPAHERIADARADDVHGKTEG
jgi:hypothetical protein